MSGVGEIAGWVAMFATMTAAMMTASNLGPRVTGWGFVVFTVASVAWVIDATSSGNSRLLYANAFLILVNAVGVYRWLGRETKLADGAEEAMARSQGGRVPTLFSAAMLQGCPVENAGGEVIGHAAGAMIEEESGRLSYMLLREGGVAGVGERLHALPWDAIDAAEGRLRARVSGEELAALPAVDPEHWPTSSPQLQPLAGRS